MITQRHRPDSNSSRSSRPGSPSRAHGTTLDQLRDRFVRQRGPPVRRRPDRDQHPRRPRRARRPLPRPRLQPGHDHLGLPLARSSATTIAAATPCRGSSPTGRPAAWRPARPTPPATATPAAASPPASCAPWRGGPPRSCRPRPHRSGSGTGGACSSPTGRTSPCPTRRRTRRPTRNRRPSSPGSASRWPGSPCCCRWRPAPATTWPSPRTPARGPARPRCCGGCTTRCRPATWSWPTPCSTTTSSPANCAARHRAGRPRAGGAGGEPDAWRPGPMARSSLWQRPNKPRGMTGEQYRRYPKSLLMRQVTVDARDQDNRAERFKVVTTILDASIDGGQIGDLYERRWSGRSRHPFDQVGDADGRPAVQVAGDGAQGDLGPPAGVQPAADGDGRGGGRGRASSRGR